MEKSEILDLLRSETVDIEFIKANGETRLLTCTLKPESLPAQIDVEEHVQKKAPNDAVCAVFDTINQGWRSFRWDSVLTINGEKYSG